MRLLNFNTIVDTMRDRNMKLGDSVIIKTDNGPIMLKREHLGLVSCFKIADENDPRPTGLWQQFVLYYDNDDRKIMRLHAETTFDEQGFRTSAIKQYALSSFVRTEISKPDEHGVSKLTDHDANGLVSVRGHLNTDGAKIDWWTYYDGMVSRQFPKVQTRRYDSSGISLLWFQDFDPSDGKLVFELRKKDHGHSNDKMETLANKHLETRIVPSSTKINPSGNLGFAYMYIKDKRRGG